ncbi:DsbA family protein [Chelativorans intermedius]|uniref:DsbA family protein n=1 Tax=Chelativorans intermedius TaxID=515947 RepID=A0ABV6DCT1_9HYPH|nr:thioredoxin domain-containing protein [Chelativorans intermedius]
MTNFRSLLASDATGALNSIMGMTGMSADEVESCLTDQALLDKITAVAESGRKLGVDSTPTFFVNGKPYKGSMTIEQFSAILDPLLAAE